MCGIAGILNFSGSSVVPEVLWQMVDVLKHRGPDDSGVFIADAVGLGQTRLNVIDLSGGHQPTQNIARSASIVFNGEIFNYVELRMSFDRKAIVLPLGATRRIFVVPQHGPFVAGKVTGIPRTSGSGDSIQPALWFLPVALRSYAQPVIRP